MNIDDMIRAAQDGGEWWNDQGPWERAPEHDRRIVFGDDEPGDAWRNLWTGEVRLFDMGLAPGVLPDSDEFGEIPF